MSQPYVVFVLGEPFIPLRAYHKLFGINIFGEIQTISVCSCDGVVAEGSHDLRMEMPPRVVDIFLPEMCWTQLLCKRFSVGLHARRCASMAMDTRGENGAVERDWG